MTGTPAPPPTPAPLGVDEVRSRAASGAALLGARSVLVYIFGTGANLLLASLLVPRDFGLVALGTMLVVLGTAVSEGGLGAGLIARSGPPEPVELRAVLAMQLGLTTLLAAVAIAIAVPFGDDGLVVASMVVSLPIAALRAPSVIVLERQLRYRTIATADVAESLAYYAWAVGTVALGFGVWGLATAVVVRAATGTGIVLAIGPLGPMRPRWSWPHVRPLVRFGAMVQFTVLLQVAREQGLNVVVAAVAGVATLGVWNLAWRVLQVPSLLFLTLARVAFPAVSRLLEAGRDPRRAIERALGAVAAMTAVALVGLTGVAAALPSVVGQSWADVPAALLWACVGLVISAPISVAASGYLFAAGEARLVAVATVVSAVVWSGVAAVLLPRYGAPAVGLGWVAGGTVNAAFLWRRTAARTGAAIGRSLAAPTLVAFLGVATGWLVAHAFDDRLIGGLVGAVAAEVIAVAGLVLFAKPASRDARDLIRQALGSFGRRGGHE
jgi:O-antigen/teichoic acid export membrane protein